MRTATEILALVFGVMFIAGFGYVIWAVLAAVVSRARDEDVHERAKRLAGAEGRAEHAEAELERLRNESHV